MRITREVIVDLLPVYASGEASSATRTLVEEYLSQDPELMEQVLRLKSEDHLDFPEVTVPPELAMRSLRRTKSYWPGSDGCSVREYSSLSFP